MYVVKLPVAVAVSIVIFPLATVLAWTNLLRRRDLTSSHKGLWLVLCLMPVLGPLLYLGIGRGRLELTFDKISGLFSVALVILLVLGARRLLGGSSQNWQVNNPGGATLIIPQLTSFLVLLLLVVGGFSVLEWLFGPAVRRSSVHGQQGR